MAKYTLLHYDGDDRQDWLLVPSADIYDVTELRNDYDGTYILEPSGELRPTDGYYPMHLIESGESRVVVEACHLSVFEAGAPAVKAFSFCGAEVEVYDVSTFLAPSAKAVDVLHDGEREEIIFDDAEHCDCWRSAWSGEATKTPERHDDDIHGGGSNIWYIDGWPAPLRQTWYYYTHRHDEWELLDADATL